MKPLLTKKEDTPKAKVAAGKTLSSLAAEKGLPGWQDIALYNWGTVEPAEVNRLLFEYVGWEQSNDDPGQTVLKPHANADRDLQLPDKWSKGSWYAVDKTHTIKVKPQIDPPVAVRIESLSRWFIPGKEKCDLVYSLEGLAKSAAKVDFAVYGSNYCTAGDWNDGFVKFNAAADLKDTKLYENAEQATAAERGKNLDVAEWKGTVTATTGALGKKNPGNKTRVINAAFSPYTAQLRYYKDDADKAARLDLDAFWPKFADDGTAVADSLKIRFAVRGTSRIDTTQGGGTLMVVDNAGDTVYREPVSLANLAKKDTGFNEIAWNGNYSPHTKNNSKGQPKAIAEDMPYRLQVQVHTGPGQASGLALAAMSTEVRIYVHPQTHPLTLDPYVADTDQTSLAFLCKRDLLTPNENIVRGNGKLWVRHQLARTGFHPGPVDDEVAAAYSSSLTEFKKSVPKRKALPANPFERLPLDATEGADVLDALEDMAGEAVRHRKWFGDPGAARADFDFDADALHIRLRDPNGELIVWVDDRHYYTDPNWLQGIAPKGAATRTKLTGHVAGMGNYAGAYTNGDAVITDKATWIARPWIPIAAVPMLLGKAQDLTDVLAPPSEADSKIMAEAIGPLRVDWSFDEIEADPLVETSMDQTMYSSQVSRPKLAMEHYRNSKKSAAYARKDMKKSCVYLNAPVDAGGVRPAATATYYQAMFAKDAESLKPWKATAASATETIATIVHDTVGQADDSMFAKRLGMSGIYLRPPTIAGDGMRLRAQMRFQPEGEYKFPNLAVLEQRYPRLPQAQTAKMRVWRKASVRSYISWSPNNSWDATKAGLFRHFDAAYLHFVYEMADAAVAQDCSGYFGNNAAFKTLVKEALTTGVAATPEDQLRAQDANISFHPQRLWPWYNAAQFGVFEPSNPDQSKADAVAKFYKVFSDFFLVLTNLYGLEWVKLVESRTGKMRGHTVVEFQAGDDFFVQRYKCQTCNIQFWYVEKTDKGDTKVRAACPSGCGGQLGRNPPTPSGSYTCGNGHTGSWQEDALGGGKFHNAGCVQAGCASKLAADMADLAVYKCDKCNSNFQLSDIPGNSPAGSNCHKPLCDGHLQKIAGYSEIYKCSACNVETNHAEATAAGGSKTGNAHQGCTGAPGGVLTRKAPPAVAPLRGRRVTLVRAEKSNYKGIPVPSLGNPLGISLNSAADTELWAHELAHNRYMEHAANAGGANNAQHDHENNTVFNFAAINETVATVKGWDRTCLMTYATHLATYDATRDRRIMCGKCFLKVRGWKLGGLADAAGNLHE